MFVDAEVSRRVWDTGETASFCVHGRRPFDIPRSDEAACDADGQRRVNIAKFSIEPGANQWNFK